MDDMEEDYFDVSKILQELRLGRYIETEGSDFAYSFSGRITDFNIWSRPLSSRDSLDWTRCKRNVKPDLGERNVFNLIDHDPIFSGLGHSILDPLGLLAGGGKCPEDLRLSTSWSDRTA